MARDFDGSGNERISYTLDANQTGMDDISIFSWLYPDSTSQYKRHFERDDSTAGGADDTKIEFDDGWGHVFKAGWSSANGAWSISKPSTGAWHSLLVTYSWSSTSNDPTFYRNGSSVGYTERVTPSGTKGNSSTTFVIGANISGGAGGVGSWDGRIAEFAIWNRQLTADEAAALGAGYAPSYFKSGLVFYLPLTGRDANVRDRIYGTAGTISGTPDAIAHPRIIYPSTKIFLPAGSSAATTQTDTFTIDGIVLTEVTDTFTIDGIVKAQTTDTFTIDGIVLVETTDTFTIDGIVKAQTTDTFTIDGIVKAQTTDTFTIDGIVLATQTDTFTIDGIVLVETTDTFTIDGVITAAGEDTFTIDGIVKAQTTDTFTIDGIVLEEQTDTFTIDGIVLVEATDTFTIDGIVKAQTTDTFTIDGIVTAYNTDTFTIDGIVSTTNTGTFTIDAVVAGESPGPGVRAKRPHGIYDEERESRPLYNPLYERLNME